MRVGSRESKVVTIVAPLRVRRKELGEARAVESAAHKSAPMNVRSSLLFALLVGVAAAFIAAPASAQDPAELERLRTRKYPPALAPQHIEPTGDSVGVREIARGVIDGQTVEFARGEIIVVVNDVEEGSDPTAYISPIVTRYNLTYIKPFSPQLTHWADSPSKALLLAPDDEAFVQALKALQKMPFVRLAAINTIGRLYSIPSG